MPDSKPILGFIEQPNGYSPLREWIEYRDALREVEQTPEVRGMILEATRVIEEKRRGE